MGSGNAPPKRGFTSVSWNGATDVARWQVVAGPDARHLRLVATAAKGGFETEIHLGHLFDRLVAVRALAPDGRVLASSRAVTP